MLVNAAFKRDKRTANLLEKLSETLKIKKTKLKIGPTNRLAKLKE